MLLFFQLTRSIDPVNRHVRWSQLDIFLWRAQRAEDKIEGLGSHFDCEILVYWVFVRSSSLPEVLEALKTALTGFPDSLAPAHTTLPGPVRLLTGNNLVNELGFFSNSIEVVTVFLLTSCNQLMVIPCLARHRQCTKRQSSDAHQPTRSRMFFTSLHFLWLPSSYPDRQDGYSPLLFQ